MEDREVAAKRMARMNHSPRPSAAPTDAPAARRPKTDIGMSPQEPVSFTYGSWMELGLAARQMVAASQPSDAVAGHGSRRR